MANPEITNSDIAEALTFNGVFRDRTVTVATGEVLAKHTVLGIDAGSAATAGSQTTIPLSANLAALIAISNGEFTITVDGGTPANITGIDMTSDTSVTEVAATIDAAITAEGATATVVNGDQIVISSDTTGATSSIALAQYVGAGTDLSTAARLNFADLTTVAGAAATAQAVVLCASTATDGSDKPRFVLAQELDNSAGVSPATFEAQVLVSGEVDGSLLVFDNGSDDLDTLTSDGVSMRDALKSENIITTFRSVEDELDNQ